MKTTIVTLFLFFSSAFAQIDFNVYTGVNYLFGTNSFSNYMTNNYYPGVNLGASANYFVAEKFSFSPFAEYSNYFFNHYNGPSGGIPEISFVSASGSSSQFYKLGVNVKFFPSAESLPQGYLFTGISWNIADPGEINITWYDMNRGYFQSVEQIEVKNYFAQTIGFGVKLFNFNSVGLAFEGILFTNYSDRTSGSANIGVYF